MQEKGRLSFSRFALSHTRSPVRIYISKRYRECNLDSIHVYVHARVILIALTSDNYRL